LSNIVILTAYIAFSAYQDYQTVTIINWP